MDFIETEKLIILLDKFIEKAEKEGRSAATHSDWNTYRYYEGYKKSCEEVKETLLFNKI